MRAARGLCRAASMLAILGLALTVPTATVTADCSMAPLAEAVRTSEVVFVGTVTAIENDGRIAGVRVDEVWRGGGMPAEVAVFGGTEPQPMEDDRTYEVGVRYLFVPLLVDGRMVDTICTATAPWVEDFGRFRPDDVTPAGAAEPPPSGLLAFLADLALPLLTALVIGGAAVVIAVVVARRRAI